MCYETEIKMRVCIAEKPSVAKEIADIVGAKTKKDGYYEGNGYRVTWTFGHLCTLKEPHEYTPQWKSWSLWTLPMIPPRFGIKLIPDKGIEKQFAIIEKLMSEAEAVINCGDAGQEGELIQRWVMQKAGCKCPVYRLWISSLTEESIREGFASLKRQEEFNTLYEAGLSRAIGDWLLGINATRLYTIKYGQSRQVLSIGRVQTPTLALIVNRQLEIDNFVSQPYWELKTIYRDTVFSVTKGRFSTVEEGEVFLQQVQGGPFEVVDIAKKQGKESPPRLFDLTSLQVECNKKFAYSAEDTLKLIQSLYEKKVTTYPRVDTTFLSDDIYPKVPNILQVLQTSQVYEPLINPLWRSNLPKSKKVFDNSKVTDHHAIIPTNVRPSNLTDNERKVYDLVVRRFIAAFYPDCRVATTTVLGKVGNIEFKATGKQIIEPGWRIVFEKEKDVEKEEKDTDEERVLPDFVKGESGPHEPALGEKWTQPPKYYTEATLLRAMETAGRLVENDELRDALKENGIGRPSTRAAIIETLFKRNYEELLKSAELTGIWENKLRRIERNEYRAKDFLEELKLMVAEIVNKVKHDQAVRSITIQTPLGVQASNTEKEKNDTITKKGRKDKEKKKNEGLSSRKEDTQGKSIQVIQSEPILCPVCGKGYIVKGKTAYGCSDWKDGCNFRLSFDEYGENLVDSDLKIIVQKFRDSMAGGLSLFPE